LSFIRMLVNNDLAFAISSAISPGHLYSPAQFSPASDVSLKCPSTMLPTKADCQKPWVLGKLNWQPQFTAQLQLS
jgi:hypothetical protein